MKIICFLRDLGISINSIGDLLKDSDPEAVISLLMDQQEEQLRAELEECQIKLGRIAEIKRHLKSLDHVSVDSIGDIAHLMENKHRLFKMRLAFVLMGIAMECIETGTAIYWWLSGIWWPFAVGMSAVILLSIVPSRIYYKMVAYLCPHCHTIFVPTFKELFGAYHTIKMRKLTCPHCKRKGYCLETTRKEI